MHQDASMGIERAKSHNDVDRSNDLDCVYSHRKLTCFLVFHQVNGVISDPTCWPCYPGGLINSSGSASKYHMIDSDKDNTADYQPIPNIYYIYYIIYIHT